MAGSLIHRPLTRLDYMAALTATSINRGGPAGSSGLARSLEDWTALQSIFSDRQLRTAQRGGSHRSAPGPEAVTRASRPGRTFTLLQLATNEGERDLEFDDIFMREVFSLATMARTIPARQQ